MDSILCLPQPIRQLQVPLIYILNIFALALGPQNQFLRIALTLPALVLLICQSLYPDENVTWGIRFAICNLTMCLAFVYFDWIILASPDREKWRKINHNNNRRNEGDGGGVKGKGKEREEVEDVPKGFWQRVWWGVRLAATNRYTGWTSQVKNVPMGVEGDYPRWLFVLRKSGRAALFYFLSDAIHSFTAASPHGSWSDIVHLNPPISYAEYPFWYRFRYAWVHIALTYVSLELFNTLYGIASVVTGLANPRDCPSMFGDLKDMYTVRRAWAMVWHQNCRRICATPGIFLTRNVLHLRKGSFSSKYIQLFVGFTVSAIVHGGGTTLSIASYDDDGAFCAFLAQAVIILIEDHVIEFGKRLGLKDAWYWRVVGYGWTVFWIGSSSEQLIGRWVGHGTWIHDRKSDWFGIAPRV